MENHWVSLGKLLTSIGGLLVAVGLTLWLSGDRLTRSSNFWLGHLPGDIRVERPDFTFYLPLTTMVLVSIGLSLALWAIGQLKH